MTAWLNHIDSTFPGKLHYWKMGNEPWGGCPPPISITQYIERYNNYKVAIPPQLSGKLFRIADGGSGNGTPSIWLDSLMRFEVGSIEGATYHYYTGLNGSGPSFNFTEAQYNERMQLAWAMENKMVTCETIMNKYDPENTVGLMVDEWGAWYTEIPNMGFTYQQNTCRDAVIASMHLNIFNNHCRRVKMAMVAQPVNVIQALLLTKNPPTTDMIKTPTFYVFKMYKVHQNAKMIPATLATGNTGGVPYITASASVDSKGMLHISMCNTHISDEQLVSVKLQEAPGYDSCTGTIINGPKYDSYNDYGGVEPVNIKPLAEEHLSSFDGSSLVASLPAHSVVTFTLTPAGTTGVNRKNLQNRKNRGHGVWSVKPVPGGKVHLQTPASEAVPVILTLVGIDGKTIITSDVMTVIPGASGSTWQPAGKNHYSPGVYILRITTGKETTAFRVVLSN
ncbi:MAG: hypothetical protein JW863_22750 [Chitinispirillaceae bacterium]|nr:hypothetical protein [Chitinispirillaceae bacterium]